MGGRGGSSGMRVATVQQHKMMENLKKRNEKYSEYSAPKFSMNKDGSVSYEYKKERLYTHVHGGKMRSPEKDDIYRRTEVITGKSMKDGLLREDKPVKTEVLVKKGRR